jgi:DNA-binding HxlR family transcriptional regulator
VKSYRQFCAVARALDVVGDRWALLVIRDLLPGPLRYTDLLQGLPGVGTNVLATRLRELEAAGVVARRRLPTPTPVMLYELTDDGRDLRGVIDSLAQWGTRRLTTPADGDTVEPRWFVASLAATVDASALDDRALFEVRLDDERFALRVEAARLVVTEVAGPDPTATVTGTLRDLFAASRGDRNAARRVKVNGDRGAGARLVAAICTGGAT